MAGPLDLLDQQVEPLGAPAGEGAPERFDLIDRVHGAALDRLVEKKGCVLGIAGADAQEHPIKAGALEALGPGEHQLADPIQRIPPSTAVAEGLVLNATTDLIEAAVGQAHDVEGIGDPDRVIEASVEPCAVGLG